MKVNRIALEFSDHVLPSTGKRYWAFSLFCDDSLEFSGSADTLSQTLSMMLEGIQILEAPPISSRGRYKRTPEMNAKQSMVMKEVWKHKRTAGEASA